MGTKTKEAHIFLKKSKAFQDVDQVYKSKRFRAGKGKMRDRKRIMKKGPLVIFDQDQVITSYICLNFFKPIFFCKVVLAPVRFRGRILASLRVKRQGVGH